MATNTSTLKTFAQETRKKLISVIKTKMDFILTQDSAMLRGWENQIENLKNQIETKGKNLVVEEVAYTWFNRIMALRFMDANDYNSPKVITPALGQMRPEILQEAMAGNIDNELNINLDDNPDETELYRRLIVAVSNSYGQNMPFLFEKIADYTQMLLPDDLLSEQSFVAEIRRAITDEDCQNVEIMGWLYQFYITDRKADAEIQKTKKGGLKSDEQAAATQLFTPHWVVRYMVENSLGRIWLNLHPESNLKDQMPYYICATEAQKEPIPENIKSVTDIKFIDPCMGSGHVLVYAFDIFTKMYEEEGYQRREIPSLILENNIFGIDIDPRCYQLASFALTMKARAYNSRFLRKAVAPKVIALRNIDRQTIASTGQWSEKSNIWQFENVDTIGSLLQITQEEYNAITLEEGSINKANQQRLKQQAEFLSRKYHCVVTNPPYLGKGFGEELKNFVNKNYPNTKYDLYAAFIENLSDKVCENGFTALVTMESWMFLSSFERLRKYILENKTIISLSHFDWNIMRIAFGTVAFVLQNKLPNEYKGVYSYLDRKDVDLQKELPYVFPKTDNGRYGIKSQSNFDKIPGSPIGYWVSEKMIEMMSSSNNIGLNFDAGSGLSTSNNVRFLRKIWEVSMDKISASGDVHDGSKWYLFQKGGEYRKWFGNLEYVVNWGNDGEEIKYWVTHNPNDPKTTSWSRRIFNAHMYFKIGITWSVICSGKISFRYMQNESMISNAAGGITKFDNFEDLNYMLGALNSIIWVEIFNIINPTINYSSGVIQIAPMPNKVKKIEIASLAKENISISKLDWDAHETSWDFQTNELVRLANDNQLLEDIVNIYKSVWTEKFFQLHKNEEFLNQQFIEIYGLDSELSPDVPFNEITILQKGEISILDNQIVWHDDVIIKQFISYLVGCFMGRFSIDRPGLIIASQHQDLNALDLKVDGLDNGASGRIAIDDDGIVPVLEGEYFPDDMTVRIQEAIKTIFGQKNYYQNIKFIDQKLGKSLREYLFKDFYPDHIDGKMYQKRPIYWLISSKMGDKKKKGYFKALIYMHRIESDTLSKLHADYVNPYIDMIEQQRQEALDNSIREDINPNQRNKSAKLAAEYAVQVRELKEFATELVQKSTQRLTINLDDGVRLNYPKFYPLVEVIKGLEKED